MKIQLEHLTNLCTRFQVMFSITTDTSYIYYNFGSLKWAKQPFDELSLEDYLEISMRLAATYPEKILPQIPDLQTIAFEICRLDTHGAYNQSTDSYTIVRSDNYIWNQVGSKDIHEGYLKAGSVIFAPNWIQDKNSYNQLKK